MRREGRLAAELDTLFLGIGPASRGALQDAAAFELRRDAKDRKNDLAKSEVVSRNGSASDRIPAPARCISRAITRRSVVSRDSRSTAGVITTSPGVRAFMSLASCGRSAVVPVILNNREDFFNAAANRLIRC
jgi:hypothetical protein